MRLHSGLALAVAAWLAGTSLQAQDAKASGDQWPQFRGPGGQGIGREGLKLPARFGPTEHVIWKMALPSGHSSPCVWNDRIFVTGYDKPAKKLETICLDRATGKVQWRQTAPTQKIERLHPLNNPASSTPATDGAHLYVYFGSLGMLCYTLGGELKWQRPLEPIPGGFGSATSPIVAGDLVLLNSGTTQQSFKLLALDRRNGKTVWEKDRPRGFSTGLWSTPLVRQAKGGDEVIVAGGPQVAAYALADGAARWQLDGLPSVSLSTPVVGDGLVFLTLTNPIGDIDDNVVKLPAFDELVKKHDRNKDAKLSADEVPDDLFFFTRNRADKIGDWAKVRESMVPYDRDKDKALDAKEWEAMNQALSGFTSQMVSAVTAIRPTGQTEAMKAQVAWNETKQVPDVPSPLYHQGRLYLVTDRGIAICRDATTGKQLYRERLGVEGACYSSPVLGDGKIYVGSESGMLVVIKAGDRFEVLAQNDLGEGILATPALLDNKVYLRTKGHLYAFGE